MSDTTVLEFVKVNANECLNNVILLHMNKESCNADEIIEKMKKVACGANVDAAVAGKSWDLKNPSECPF